MSIHLPQGFKFGGVHAGIKSNPQKEDIALVVCPAGAVAAGMYTQNLVYAAPVAIDRARNTFWRYARGGSQFGKCECLHGETGHARC